MINLFQFDNANVNGDKEAVILPNAPTLINKLIANEANNIKDKLNELVENANAGGEAVAFLDLRLKFKGSVLGVANTADTLEVGDVVQGFADAATLWANATYNGGDPADRANYTPFGGAVEYGPILEVSDGTSNVVILPNGFKAKNVWLNKGLLYNVTEWVQSADALEILGGLVNFDEVYITN